MSTPTERSNLLKSLAISAGFSRAGVALPGPFPESANLIEWLRRGYHGEMSYMEGGADARVDVRLARPWVRSILALALDYGTDHPLSTEVPDDPERGWISRYAWGRDYHFVAEKRLKALVARIDAEPSLAGRWHWTVDTGPVLEKVIAARAGLGWQGKSTLLIHPRSGTFFFLAMILTDQELEPDAPLPDRCGSCTACLDACPTAAFPEAYVLDARRCISYLTIEQKGDIPEALREGVGRHVFGCDICQDVCPYNRKAEAVDEPDFQPREGLFHPRLDELAALTPDGFRTLFTRSPVKRRKYEGLLMNVASARRRVQDRDASARRRTEGPDET